MQYVWVILLFLPSTLSQYTGRFRVVVPEAPVFSVPGSDVVLSCSVRESDNRNILKNAVDLNVTWSRSDLGNSLVHLYGNHKDLNTDQIPSYRGRTAVFKEQLKNGDTSLKLSNVQITDEGEYRCRVDSKSWENSKTFKLSVEAVGSEPVISVEKYESGKFSLLCESKGWYPEPELQWRNIKDDNLTAETETQRVAGLFNVKSRITVEEIDSYFCSVTQRHHVKEGWIDAQTLHEHVLSAWKTVVIIIGVILLLAVLAGIVFCLCKVKLLLNSDGDGRLQHHYLCPCQWWYVKRTLLKSEEDLKEFILRKFDPSDRGVEKLQKVIASSKKAVLKQCDLTEKSCEVLASVLSSENSLTDLDLSLNKLQDSGVEKLREGLKNSHCKLQILRLEDCDLKVKSCADLAEVLRSEDSKLIELNLSKNRELKDSGVKKLRYGLLNKNCKLKILRLEDCDLTKESCTDLTEVLQSLNSTLIELNLSKNPGLNSGVQNLCYGLKHKKCKLEILRLEHCDLTEESCKDLAKVLKSGNCKLMELNLSKNKKLEDSGVKKLCCGLKSKICKLQILRLEDCDLSEGSCEHLAEVLQSENSKLIELNLSKNTGLKDSGVKKLCSGLRNKNCKLQILRLDECRIKNEGFTALASALIKNPSSPLEELDLSRNEIKVSELKLLPELRTKFPNLKVKLDGCRIKNEGFTAPASENPSSPLEELDLSGNELKESDLKLLPELKDKSPNLKVKLDECSVIYEGCAALASENQDLSGNDQKESEKLLPDDDTFV